MLALEYVHRLFVVWMLRRIADSFLAWREHVQASNHAQQIQRLLNSERSKREKMKMTFERLLVNEKHLADLSHAARRASHDIRVSHRETQCLCLQILAHRLGIRKF